MQQNSHGRTKRNFVVTGASRGIGEHFARRIAADGDNVILVARSGEKLEAITNEILNEGGQASFVIADVSDAASISNAIASIPYDIDVLVNNAGISQPSPALKTSADDFKRVVETNLNGVFFTAQAVGQRMQHTGGGAIVNVASILGLRVSGGLSSYIASKSAVVQITKALALEWARYNIRVNALCPGYIETPMNRDFLASEAGAQLIRRIPQRRLGQMSDLDEPLRLLCSPGASYVTGAVLAVDGGHLVSGL